MYYEGYMGHMGYYGWFGWLGGILMILFWILVIWLIVWIMIRNQQPQQKVAKKPLDIIKERYAKGDITKKEYAKMKKEIGI
jgi:putative membrane protein